MRIKGTIFLQLVKLIRAFKDKDWNKYLQPEDWQVINSIVVASRFYPDDLYWRVANATFREIAESKMENVVLHGINVGKDILNVYKSTKVDGDPVASIENVVKITRTLFDGENEQYKEPEIEKGTNYIKNKQYFYLGEKNREKADLIYNTIAGIFQAVAENAGAKNIKTATQNRGEYYEISLTWE